MPPPPKKTSRRLVDIDKGYKAFRRTVDALAREDATIVTGLFGAEGAAVHPSSKLGESVATIAAKNEFGIGVPERSFLRSTWDLQRDRYEDYAARGLQREIVDVARTNVPINTDTSVTLKRLALRMEGDIKRRIGRREIPPPNAPSTIARKGSSTPLIDTGHLRRVIVAKVQKGRPRGGP